MKPSTRIIQIYDQFHIPTENAEVLKTSDMISSIIHYLDEVFEAEKNKEVLR